MNKQDKPVIMPGTTVPCLFLCRGKYKSWVQFKENNRNHNVGQKKHNYISSLNCSALILWLWLKWLIHILAEDRYISRILYNINSTAGANSKIKQSSIRTANETQTVNYRFCWELLQMLEFPNTKYIFIILSWHQHKSIALLMCKLWFLCHCAQGFSSEYK